MAVVITGELEERVFLTFEQFEPQHTFTGFLLYDVLDLLKPQFDPDVRNDKLRFYVSATATDDYQAIVAWGELDPTFENKPILLAVTQDGESLAAEGVRLVVPDDIRGGRYVSLVETIRLDRARQPTCPKHHVWWFFWRLPKC